ncbi:MAG: sugar transferase [Flavobacteriales bacterium]|jgi:lipopolysaccharide/colanic/teichoic acid biosynthesis glycosyltransferase|nr:sugar transferase [Flavobacteriales bacterium]MBT3964665.1 sugar transferase [Flavobacteriales bacterium]MBT4704215.1 sugar transferase [Flavobacteriales bacterium]MBT4929964.1 sugar transferase [Flavobacteriales bacterium]MBT5132338.1 sugar transferase [Flavobacteriales bacterium]
MIRAFDFFISVLLLVIFSPVLLLLSLWIMLDSKGGILFKQDRIGANSSKFKILKFRTMRLNSESKGLLTVGSDERITDAGKFLRKYKLDELPQLYNVLVGEMSMVGPRPEVEKYVDLYSDDQRKILMVKPGITDRASLEYFEESDILGKSADPESTYIQEIMPRKIVLNMPYVLSPTIGSYFKTLGQTMIKILSR